MPRLFKEFSVATQETCEADPAAPKYVRKHQQ